MKHKFFIKSSIKYIFLVFPLMMLLPLLIILPLSIRTDNKTILYFPIILFILVTVFTFILYRLIRKPITILTDDYIMFRISVFDYKGQTVRWEDIEGFTDEVLNIGSPFSTGNRILKFRIKEKYKYKYKKALIINLKPIEREDELIGGIRMKIPDLTLKIRAELLGELEGKTLTYRNYVLTEEGIMRKGLTITQWNSIYKVGLYGFTLSEYRGIELRYRGYNNKLKRIRISPSSKEVYLKFVRYILIKCNDVTNDVSIDQQIYNMLRISAEQNNAFLGIAILNIFTFLMLLFTFRSEWINTYVLDPVYLLIFLPSALFWIAVIFYTAYSRTKMLYGDYRGIKKSYRLTLYSSIFLVSSFILFFIISPGSMDYIRGDLYLATGDKYKAVECYQSVLGFYPDNVEVLYVNARTNYEIGDYEQSYNLMKVAYDIFDGKWNPGALKFLPMSLVKQGKYEEAVRWCERILNEKESKKIKEVIGEYREEVILLME